MRPPLRALLGGAFAFALSVSAPSTGRTATAEAIQPVVPDMQNTEKDIGLSPPPSYLPSAPQFEQQASFVGPRTGDEEHDTYGYRVAVEKEPRTDGAER